MPPEKITDWICMCAAGQSILGEPITEEMIQDVADRYDPSFYTAMIWPHHPWPENGGMLAREVYTYNLGRVAALKAEKEDNVLKLFAQYIPNQFLMDLNSQGQKLFSSAEFWLDFQGQGYPYLVGVTATDIPASTHTEMIRLSAASKQEGISRGELMQFSLGPLNAENKNKPSFIDRLFSKKKVTHLSQTDIPEEEPEKMEELKELIKEMMAKLNEAISAGKGDTTDTPQEAAEEVRAQAEEIAILAEEVANLADEVAAAPEDEVISAEFTAARADLAAKFQAFTADDAHFAARKRRALRAFSASRKPVAVESSEMKALKNEMGELKQMLSGALGTTMTKRPSNAPAGGEKKTVL